MSHALRSLVVLLALTTSVSITAQPAAEPAGLGLRGGGSGEPQGTIGTGGEPNLTGRSRLSHVRLGRTTLVGRGLSRAQVRRVLDQNLMRARNCHEAELRQRPDLAGEVRMSFVIAPDGRVSQAIGGELLGNRHVGACLAHTLRGLTFPTPRSGEVSVTQTYVFAIPRS